jgi:hypothetical protein
VATHLPTDAPEEAGWVSGCPGASGRLADPMICLLAIGLGTERILFGTLLVRPVDGPAAGGLQPVRRCTAERGLSRSALANLALRPQSAPCEEH